MRISLTLKKSLSVFVAVLLLIALFAVPASAELLNPDEEQAITESSDQVSEDPVTEPVESISTESDSLLDDEAPNTDIPADSSDLDTLDNNTIEQAENANVLTNEYLKDIRNCLFVLVYVIFPLVSAVFLIKRFIFRTYSNFVS